jgi:hypothetical protein
MKRLLLLLACSPLLLIGCQNETSHVSEAKPADLQETTPAPATVEQEAVDPDAITTETGNVPAQTTAPQPESDSTALKAYIDPETGELTVPPEEERLKQDAQANSEKEEGEEPPLELIPLEGGGYKIPLGDRYMIESSGTTPTEDSADE